MTNNMDFNQSEQCTLDICLASEGLLFGVCDPSPREGGPSWAFERRDIDEALPLAANLVKAFEEWEWLGKPFRRVNILVATRRYALVPLDLFEEGQAENIFYQNHSREANEQICYNIGRNAKVVVLFGVDKSIRACVARQYANAWWYTQAFLLMDYFAMQSRPGDTRKMYACLHPEYMDVFCYDHGDLLLANSYKCRLTPDRIYYLLYIWQTLGFEQERDELHLCGELDDEEALLAGLRDFVRQVFVMNPSTGIDLRAVHEWDD